MTPAYAKKVDANQAQIVEALRAAGASVTDLSRFGHGVPDLLVGYNRRVYLLEVKSADGKLTPAEERWQNEWRGQSAVVRTVEQALYVIGALG
jgi:hypothetical protein